MNMKRILALLLCAVMLLPVFGCAGETGEIFVFTPNGDLRKLPEGATLLDFAFDIHTSRVRFSSSRACLVVSTSVHATV